MSDVHTCGYYCVRPRCIKEQRDELRDRFQIMQAQAEVDAKAQRKVQAQAFDPVAVADNGVLNWIDGKQFDHEADLYTQPAVNQQLLEALDKLISVAEMCDSWESFPSKALDEARAAIAAAQEQSK